MTTPPSLVRALAERVRAAGGRALLIGGAVRDRLMGFVPTDYDVEVYGLSPGAVEGIARGLGEVHDVGKTFGVLAVRLSGRRPADLPADLSPEALAKGEASDLDPRCRLGWRHELGRVAKAGAAAKADVTIHVSLPRRESKVAPGHRGFAVDADPTMTPAEAARRRDFTINAIAEDPLTGEILDPFNGRADVEARVLRVVDPTTFGADPLRVLRGAVFTAQFQLTVDPVTDALIRRIVSTPPRPQPAPAQRAGVSSVLQELPRERVGEEWRKLLLRPRAPSRSLRLLMDWGAFGVLHPEFTKLPETPQNPAWHPEGDVWTHTCMAVDEATQLCRPRESGDQIPAFAGMTDENRWRVLLATLCHDLGKGTATQMLRSAWRSPGHDAAGVEPTRRFLRAIAADSRTTEVVVRLVREHLVPLRFFNLAARGTPVSDGEIRALARRLHPATIFLLTLVADADHRGRGPFYGERGRTIPAPALDAGKRLRERAEQLSVLNGPPAPILSGSNLLALGLTPGPDFGRILRRAEILYDEGVSREELLRRLRHTSSTTEALERLGANTAKPG